MGTIISDEFKIRWEEKHGAEYGKKGFDLFSDINVMDRIVNERTRFIDVFIEKHLEFIKGYDLKLPSLKLPLQTHLDFLFNLATDLKRRLEAGEFDPPAEQAAEG